MSHIVEIETEVRDTLAVGAACGRLSLPEPVTGMHRLFGSEITGLGVYLPDWRFPVVCDLASGQVRYDNWGGRWGDQSWLDAFLQAYAVERATLEARRKGYSVTEQQMGDGSIRLMVNAGGAA